MPTQMAKPAFPTYNIKYSFFALRQIYLSKQQAGSDTSPLHISASGSWWSLGLMVLKLPFSKSQEQNSLSVPVQRQSRGFIIPPPYRPQLVMRHQHC